MAQIDEYFESFFPKELKSLIVGKKLGSGYSREVFEYLPDPTCVIKFEITAKAFANALEWETWDRVQHVKNVAKWFAPCVAISDCGSILIQKKTAGLMPYDYPAKIPGFFADTKYANFGVIGNQFVCRDYAIHLMMEKGMAVRMRKVDWYGD